MKYFKYFLGLMIVVLLVLVGVANAEVVEFIKEETKETLTPEEYLELVKFVLEVDRSRIGEFWMSKGNTILSLAATYLRIEETKDQRIYKDYRYRLILLRGEINIYDFVSFRKNIVVFIVNLNTKGEILIKPKTKLIVSKILPIENTEFMLQVNLYE